MMMMMMMMMMIIIIIKVSDFSRRKGSVTRNFEVQELIITRKV